MVDKVIDYYITTSKLGSGWAAVCLCLVVQDDNILDSYWDIEQTGTGRYESEKEAEIEGRGWALSEGIRYGKEKVENKCPIS